MNAVRCASAAVFTAMQLLAALVPGQPPLTWSTQLHVTGVVDVSAPRADGRLVVSGGSRLWLLDRRTGALTPFATGPGGYPGGSGDEPYLALSPGTRVPSAGCAFAPDELYVIQQSTRQVLRIDADGASHAFATVDGVDSLGGIAFDTTGRFGGRLLVIAPSHGATVVVAVDCRGTIEHVTDRAPVMEGGIAVAPPGFGAFGGDLVAADELSGQILAVRPDGSTGVVARSGLPAGGDIGVEGVGFVPGGFGAGGAAYFADRSTPGSPHPGTDTLLRLDAGALEAAGVRDGDLLAATEGGARTIAVRCAASCAVSEVAVGPARAHGEGHVMVVADHPAASAAALPEAADLGAAARTQGLVARLLAGAAAAALVAALVGLVLWLRRRRRTPRSTA
jgi:hypothetical protein